MSKQDLRFIYEALAGLYCGLDSTDHDYQSIKQELRDKLTELEINREVWYDTKTK